MLATAKTVHGYNAEYLLIGIMISLPKDHKANICDSNYYKGICLCSCINKLLEWCMIHRYGDKLYTSSLQLSFKSDHSTSMCSLALKEVVNYYRNGRSKVYACFMDASKAFNRIRHDKLFKILQDREIHPLALRLIIYICIKDKRVERHGIM